VTVWTGFIWQRIGTVAGAFNRLNTPSNFITSEYFLDQLTVNKPLWCCSVVLMYKKIDWRFNRETGLHRSCQVLEWRVYCNLVTLTNNQAIDSTATNSLYYAYCKMLSSPIPTCHGVKKQTHSTLQFVLLNVFVQVNGDANGTTLWRCVAATWPLSPRGRRLAPCYTARVTGHYDLGGKGEQRIRLPR
jgi:hypothetical protein